MLKDNNQFWGILKTCGATLLAIILIKLLIYVGDLICTLI